MNCAIFCFLAFCAFKTVFADTRELKRELYSIREISVNRIFAIGNRLYSDIRNAIEPLEQRGIKDVQTCWEDYDAFMKYHNTRFIKWRKCHDEAVITENIKFAKSCSTDILAELENQVKLNRANAKECIKSKYIHKARAVVVREPPSGLKNYQAQL